AVFAMSDEMAFGALRALRRHGIRPGHDIAIVGFDDIEDGRYHTPSLSTVSPDKQLIAQLAVERLVTRLDEDPDAGGDLPHELWAPHRLEARESSVGSS
ncbi:MAG: substrate-binding domain-containing protein, partial [bacterium]